MKKKIEDFYCVLHNYKKRYYRTILIYASSSVIDIFVLSLLPFLISSFLGKESSLTILDFNLLLNERNGILIIGCLILILTFFKGFFNYYSIFNSIKLSSEIQKKIEKKYLPFTKMFT